MIKYFEELFSTMSEEENIMLGEMVIKIDRKEMSFDDWRESLSEEERKFALELERKVDSEFYNILDDESENQLYLFAEIMVYYVTYDGNMGCELPAIARLYSEAMQRW